MRWRAQSAARSRNPAEPVVALLVVLGLSSVEVKAIEMWSTGGLRAWRPANVSSWAVEACLLALDGDFVAF